MSFFIGLVLGAGYGWFHTQINAWIKARFVKPNPIDEANKAVK